MQLEQLANRSINDNQSKVETTPTGKQNVTQAFNTSTNEYMTPDSKQISMSFLSKPIGEIQFPVGTDIRQDLLHSVNNFVASTSQYENEEDDEYGECDEYEEGDSKEVSDY